ncbi:hypothetical protein [Streptomyces sp. GC420]|uniref:hypothetical protein n=1 Tax=Streptomyces sp. GC420 TaxID=2697568 RepID=UPI001414EBDF|nr:hypothetical protein [Streptomyces sp. GC420]NBM16704.1 hypothetical protein [Streptomyces sp. GC420]
MVRLRPVQDREHLFTVALAGKRAADGITADALHPGGIMTNLQRHLDEGQLRSFGALDDSGEQPPIPPGWKTPEQGAATSVLLAAPATVEGVSGHCFEDCNEARLVTAPGDFLSGVAPTPSARTRPNVSGRKPSASWFAAPGREPSVAVADERRRTRPGGGTADCRADEHPPAFG